MKILNRLECISISGGIMVIGLAGANPITVIVQKNSNSMWDEDHFENGLFCLEPGGIGFPTDMEGAYLISLISNPAFDGVSVGNMFVQGMQIPNGTSFTITKV